MYTNDSLWIAHSDKPVCICPSMANRHGLIAGATGTGKTTTLKVMAESFSAMGVPVFLSDVKGDISGTCVPGVDSEKMQARISRFGIDNWEYTSFPTRFWDIFGEKGHPVRITVSDMGPTLLARMLGRTEVQTGVLNLVFRIADDNGLLLLDMKDLRSMLQYCGEHRTDFTTEYGNMSAQSIGAIQRALLTLEDEGGDIFFGEPALDIHDWMMTDETGRGYINILNSTRLINSPVLYSTFLLWMLSELFERLPEEGDLDMPKMVFFFDEAHLLFNDAPKALLTKITQVVKLIRSKGVGVYFITQSPSDIPDEVLAQLSNRVQHALRAYTPAEQKAVRTAAQTFRPNPAFKTEDVIGELGVGETLVSFLDENGVPGIVERAFILPPQSLMKPAAEDIINQIIAESELEELYREPLDRESAYEILTRQREYDLAAEEEAARKAAEEKELQKRIKEMEREQQREAAAAARERERQLAALERERRKQEIAAQRERERRQAAAIKEREREIAAMERERERELAAMEKERERQRQRFQKQADKFVGSALNSIGREFGKSISRGLFGNRR